MVDDDLLTREELGFNEWAVTPSPDAVTPESIKRERDREAFVDSVEDGGAIVLTHTDADGLTSGALVQFREGTDTTVQPISYHGPYTFEDALQDLISLDIRARRLYILDFNPDGMVGADLLKQLTARGNEILWYDHHQWEDEVYDAYARSCGELVIDEDECTASLLARELPVKFPAYIEDLVAVTKDRDLWIRDDPRSKDLSTFAQITDSDDYIATVIDNGADLPGMALDRVKVEQERNAALKTFAVEQAMFQVIGGYDVAYTYVAGGVSSDIGNALVEDQGADIAVIANPHGGVSVYSHSDRETFARCHEVAGHFGGGGHPTAAGFGLDFDTFREQAAYWTSQGGSKRTTILMGIDEVVADE